MVMVMMMVGMRRRVHSGDDVDGGSSGYEYGIVMVLPMKMMAVIFVKTMIMVVMIVISTVVVVMVMMMIGIDDSTYVINTLSTFMNATVCFSY